MNPKGHEEREGKKSSPALRARKEKGKFLLVIFA